MIRIGLVDLDTSHPQAFTRILRCMPEVEVRALWDGHDVWPAGYERRFADENSIPVVCTRLEEMPAHVDAAMIHGTNWDTHCQKAEIFLREGKPLLIDKPVVGNVRDCDRLLNMQAKYGVPVYGGSSLRCAEEVVALRTAVGPRAGITSIVASGPGDFFSYGIHTTEMLQGCAGTGIRSVRALAGHRVPVFAMTFDDGLVALVHLQMQFHEWSLVVYTENGMHAAKVNPDKLYAPFLNGFVALLRGSRDRDSLTGPVEAVRAHIAARLSRESGTEVVLDRLPADAGFDGSAFAAEYAATKRGQSAPMQQRRGESR